MYQEERVSRRSASLNDITEVPQILSYMAGDPAASGQAISSSD